MKLHRAYACLIVKGAISSSRNAQLAVPAIPERLDTFSQPIKLGQIAHRWHQIDDRLGSQPWNRRGADVMDNKQRRAEYCLQATTVSSRQPSPFAIIRGQDYGDRRRHD